MSKTKLIVGSVVVCAIAAGAYYYLVPFQHALNVAKQKRTVADIRNVGTATFSWLTDQVGTGPQSPQNLKGLAGLDRHRLEIPLSDEEQATYVVMLQDAPATPQATDDTGPAVDLKDYKMISLAEATKLLVPQYIQSVPEVDGWGHPYEFYVNVDDVLAQQVMAIRSPGRDGKFEGLRYKVQSFTRDDFDRDIVWADGFFVAWPQSPAQ